MIRSTETTLERVRREVWGMLGTDGAGLMSRSPEGVASVMTIIVDVFPAFGSTAIEKTETTDASSEKTGEATAIASPATGHQTSGFSGHTHAHTDKLRYLGVLTHEDDELTSTA